MLSRDRKLNVTLLFVTGAIELDPRIGWSRTIIDETALLNTPQIVTLIYRISLKYAIKMSHSPQVKQNNAAASERPPRSLIQRIVVTNKTV